MARTLTFDTAFRFGFAVGVGVASRSVSDCHTRATLQDNTEAVSATSSNTVNMSQHTLHENHPLASVSGMFANDPLWHEYLRAIGEIRQEENALDNE